MGVKRRLGCRVGFRTPQEYSSMVDDDSSHPVYNGSTPACYDFLLVFILPDVIYRALHLTELLFPFKSKQHFNK